MVGLFNCTRYRERCQILVLTLCRMSLTGDCFLENEGRTIYHRLMDREAHLESKYTCYG